MGGLLPLGEETLLSFGEEVLLPLGDDALLALGDLDADRGGVIGFEYLMTWRQVAFLKSARICIGTKVDVVRTSLDREWEPPAQSPLQACVNSIQCESIEKSHAPETGTLPALGDRSRRRRTRSSAAFATLHLKLHVHGQQ